MTRQAFIDDITTWDDLYSFAYDVGYEFDNVYSEDAYNDIINDDVYDRARRDGWTDIRDWLRELPDGYDFYICDDGYGWIGRSYDDIDDLKNDLLEWVDDTGDIFDPEEEEEEQEEEEEIEPEPEDEEPMIEPDISMNDLYSAGDEFLGEIKRRADARQQELDKIYENISKSFQSA